MKGKTALIVLGSIATLGALGTYMYLRVPPITLTFHDYLNKKIRFKVAGREHEFSYGNVNMGMTIPNIGLLSEKTGLGIDITVMVAPNNMVQFDYMRRSKLVSQRFFNITEGSLQLH